MSVVGNGEKEWKAKAIQKRVVASSPTSIIIMPSLQNFYS